MVKKSDSQTSQTSKKPVTYPVQPEVWVGFEPETEDPAEEEISLEQEK